jgi:hypothetical protein
MRIDRECASALIEINPSYLSYMQPDGTLYVRVLGALYGLLEAGKVWQEKLTKSLIKLGFTQMQYDPCLFSRGEGSFRILIGCYVDDLLLCTTNERVRQEVLDGLGLEFGKLSTSDSEEHTYSFTYRGLQFEQSPSGVKVHQATYIDQLLRDERITGSALTPTAANFLDLDPDSPKLEKQESENYNKLAARLNWISTQTRPDLRFATGCLASRASQCTRSDMNKLIRVLRYLRKTKTYGLFYDTSQICLTANIDASHLTHTDRRGHSGVVISMGNEVVATRSRKQKIYAQSSCEAKLWALNTGINLLLWLRNLMLELGYPPGATKIAQDNKSCIILATKDKPTARTIHLNMRQFRVSSLIRDGIMELVYVPSANMTADILTKAAEASIFRRLRDVIHNNIGEDTKLALHQAEEKSKDAEVQQEGRKEGRRIIKL